MSLRKCEKLSASRTANTVLSSMPRVRWLAVAPTFIPTSDLESDDKTLPAGAIVGRDAEAVSGSRRWETPALIAAGLRLLSGASKLQGSVWCHVITERTLTLHPRSLIPA